MIFLGIIHKLRHSISPSFPQAPSPSLRLLVKLDYIILYYMLEPLLPKAVTSFMDNLF